VVLAGRRPRAVLGGRAWPLLARPATGTSFPGPCQRPSCGRGGDRQACARLPGAATGRRDRRRSADRPPESCPPSTRGHPHHQERQAPPGPPAATTVAQDRDGPRDRAQRHAHPAPPATTTCPIRRTLQRCHIEHAFALQNTPNNKTIKTPHLRPRSRCRESACPWSKSVGSGRVVARHGKQPRTARQESLQR
jgi:hypothetical protein